MRAIIYCRKSTDRDDMQVQSIDTQLNWCIDYCNEKNFEVIETILEAKSAKQPGRECFNKMIMMLEKGQVDTIVTLHLDRLTRNAVDEWTLKWYAQSRKIQEIHCKEWVFNGDQVLMLSIHFWFSNQYIVDLRKKVVEGIETKVKAWWIVWKTPIWYINNKETRWADINENTAHYVQRIFELRVEWKSFSLITKIINEEGLRTKKWNKVPRAVVERMIKNPFYYGVIEYSGELYQWQHEALISRELWEKANKLSRWITYVTDRDLTPLKWIVKHKETWTILCASLIKKKYTYFHLHWDRKKSLWYNQNEIIKVFDKNLHLYCIPEWYKQEVIDWLKDYHLWEIDRNETKRTAFKNREQSLQKEKSSLIKMRSLGEITSEELIELKNNLTNELVDINEQLQELDKKDDVLISNLNKTVELFVELSNKRKLLSKEQKLEIIKYMVVELQIDNQKRLHIVENSLFKAFRKLNCHNWWDKWAVGLTPLYLASLDFTDKLQQSYLILRKLVF